MNPLEQIGVQRFREIIARQLGLVFDDRQLEELARVLRERASRTSLRDPTRYLDVLGTDPDELRVLASELTTGETYFFRNHEQFTALLEVALPDRMRYRELYGPRVLRFLSAGCSSGEEAYSIAMLLRDRLPGLLDWHIEISAIDVNAAALDKARRGRYSAWSLRETPPDLQARYFTRRRDEYLLDPDILSAVRFEERNLVEQNASVWLREHYDFVFCRNVMMYFAAETTRAIVARIAASVSPGGYLFLGHAETLRGVSHAFHLHHSHDTFYYQHRNEDEVASVTQPWDGRAWIDTISRAADRIADLTTPGEASTDPAASVRVEAALDLLRQERFDDALHELDRLPDAQRHDPAAQLLRAVLLTNRGELGEAGRVCRALLELDELDAEAHYLLALGLDQLAQREESIDHDRTAAYLDATFAMPRLHLGLMAKRRGDHMTARRELDAALVLLPEESDTRVLLFGGGFSRDGLLRLCRAERRAVGDLTEEGRR